MLDTLEFQYLLYMHFCPRGYWDIIQGINWSQRNLKSTYNRSDQRQERRRYVHAGARAEFPGDELQPHYKQPERSYERMQHSSYRQLGNSRRW
jgi:hypothetical protein